MVWTSSGEILLTTDWQFTEPIPVGLFFRLIHTKVLNGALFVIAQAEIDAEGRVSIIDSQVMAVERLIGDVVKLPLPGCFTERRIAIKKLPIQPTLEQEVKRLFLPGYLQPTQEQTRIAQRSNWSVEVQVSDFVEPTATVDLISIETKLDAISSQITNLQQSGGGSTTPPTPTTQSDPQSIFTTDLIAWYRGDSVLANASNLVYQWTDKSPNNYHALQGIAGNQPLLVPDGFNSKPAVRFNLADTWLAMPDCLNSLWGEASLFIVYNLKDISAHWDAMDTGSATDSYWGANSAFNYVGYFAEFRNARLNAQPPNMTVAGQHFIEVVSGIGANSYLVNRDGINLTTTDPSWGVTNTPFIGKGTDSKRMNGDIAEIIITKKAATIEQLSNIRNYVKNFWGMNF